MKNPSSQNKKNSATLLLWCVIGVILIGSVVWLLLPKNETADVTAQLWVEGELKQSIYLPEADDGDFTLEEYGHNVTLSIQDHAIRFLESDCPDHRCVKNGWLRRVGDQSTCLPNRVSLILVESDTVGVTLPG